MVSVQSVWRQVPDPRGKQGLEHPLHALPGLMLLSMLSGRKGMMAAGQQGRGLTARQLRRPGFRRLGFRPGHASPCHATLTEILRVLDPTAMAQAFGQLTAETGAQADTDTNHLSLDGKTLCGRKDADGKAEHVLSAFKSDPHRRAILPPWVARIVGGDGTGQQINLAQFTSRVRPCYVFCEIRRMD